jgi:glycerol uptake facilitator-like aquaporin
MYSADTAGIFANYPNGSLTIIGGFIDQTVGTALLVLVVLALTDPKNSKISDSRYKQN